MKRIYVIGLMLLTLISYSSAQSKEEVFQSIVEKFCREYYSDCFSGREYVKNTAEINEVKQLDDNEYKVTGIHAYRGSFGSLYEDMDFYVYITFYSSSIKFKFYKKSKADFFHSTDYWESCTETVDI